MYNHLYKFLEPKNYIYDLQFGFQQKHFTSYSLIYKTNKIREQVEKGNFGCGVFADFHKAFDTVDHGMLFQKLNYYGEAQQITGFLHILKTKLSL